MNAWQGPRKSYQLKLQVHFGMMIPKKNTEYSIQVKWGEHKQKIAPIKSRNRLIQFYTTLEYDQAIFPHQSLEDCPDVFIYFTQGTKEKHISFLRRPATFFDLDRKIDQNRDVLPGHILQYFNF